MKKRTENMLWLENWTFVNKLFLTRADCTDADYWSCCQYKNHNYFWKLKFRSFLDCETQIRKTTKTVPWRRERTISKKYRRKTFSKNLWSCYWNLNLDFDQSCTSLVRSTHREIVFLLVDLLDYDLIVCYYRYFLYRCSWYWAQWHTLACREEHIVEFS